MTLTDLVETQTVATPDAIAVTCGDARLSYRELDRRANTLARTLAAAGIGRGARVGICVERSVEMLVALLGTLKAGAAYVPLDPGFPAARLAFIAEDAELARVVTRSDVPADGDGAPVACARDAGDVAYVLYTSGSTGRPKGVPVTHDALVNFLQSMAHEPGLTAGDTVLAVTTLSFDIAGLELWLPLIVGARVVIATRDDVVDGRRLAALLASSGATLMQATPATWRLLLASGWPGSPELTMLCGGEALPPELAAELIPRGRALWNMYGPTETTIWSSLQCVEANAPIGLGHPIANTQLYVVGENGELAPDGVAGELLIGGAGVAHGYFNRPELTAERFVPDRFGSDPDGRLYRTGDFVRRHAGGRLEYLGRIDQQIKLRGFRIELGDVESAIGSHPGVLQAAAALRTDATGEPALVGYFVARSGPPPAGADVRTHMSELVPDYMVPARFVRLDAMTLTPNGKLDRQALPEPRECDDDSGAAFVAPQTALQIEVAAIVAELLGRERVGLDDDFFALGAHSLWAMRVLERVATTFGADIPLRALFDAPTVRALARRIGGASPATVASVPLVHRPGEPVRLTAEQEALWLLDAAAPGGGIAYNLPVRLRMRGSLRPDALRRALDALLERHAALRTTFSERDGIVFQSAGPARPMTLEHADLRQADAPTAIDSFVRTPFDLERDLLFRAQLVTVDAELTYLTVMSHHIVTDGISFDVIVRELADLYQAAVASRDLALPVPAFDFSDAVRWRRDRLGDGRRAELVAFWEEQLRNAAPMLALPADRPRPLATDYDGARCSAVLAPERIEPLRKLAAVRGATLYMVLVAAYAVLLHRYTRQTDIVVGVPVADRPCAELDATVGFFVNTLPLRVRLDGERSFAEVLDDVRNAFVAALQYRDAPFDLLAQAARTGIGGAPFQTLITLDDGSAGRTAFGPFEAEYVDVETGSAKFDLSAYVANTSDGLRVLFEYRTALFERETVERMRAQFAVLLASIAEHPEGAIGSLPMLPPEEREFVTAVWNTPQRASAGCETSLTELVERQVRATPDAIAVTFGETSLTYRELDERSERLAAHLQRAGVRRGMLVGVCMRRSERTPLALLAIAKAGAAYLPLDPALPQARLTYIATDAGLPFILAEPRTRDVVRSFSTDAIVVDVDGAADAGTVADMPGAGPDDPAYVLYTSGSTGKPKGVPVKHRAIANVLLSMQREPGITADDAMLAITTLSFDIAGVEMWLPLTVGARVVVAPSEVTVDGHLLAELLRSGRITLLQATPATWRLLVAAGWEGTRGLRMITCGEALLPELARELLRRGDALWNMYGPTETTIYSSLQRIEPEMPIGLGHPVANTRLYVLEAGGEPAPIGVPGELTIGGVGVSAGYLNRPELTAERFIPDRFDAEPGAQLYRTGDLTRRRADGQLEFLGRMDHQVKLRGFRIELGEIEAVLAAHPDVRDAVAVVRNDTMGEPMLAAFYVARDPARSVGAVLREHARAELPEYMIPVRFMRLASLPLSPSGKVDRAALPALDAAEAAETPYVAPRNTKEAALAAMMARVLGLDRVGIDDDFFALGGNSLRAMQLTARIATQFGFRLPLRTIFATPTVAAIAGAVPDANERAAATIPSDPRRRSVALSSAQEALWLLDRATAGGWAYNLPSAVEVRGALDVDALRKTLDALVERHAALRTTFHSSGGATSQVAGAPRSVPLAIHDLGDGAEAGRDEHLRAFAQQRFDLTRDLLLRALVLRLGPERYVIALASHHIVSDGVTFDILWHDLSELYGALCAGRDTALPPLPLTFADAVVWQRERQTAERRQTLHAFWQAQLDGATPALALPLDRLAAAVGDNAGAHLIAWAPPDVLGDLRALATRYDTTLFVVLLAAYATLLHRYTQQNDIVIGSPVAGRNHPQLEGIAGYFVNTLPLRVRLDHDPSFASVLQQVRDTCLAAFDHEDVPFEALTARRDGGDAGSPFQTLFTLGDTGANAARLGPLVATPLDLESGSAKFDVSLALAERDEGLRCSFEYRSALFDPSTIARMAGHFGTLLAAITSDPEKPVDAVPLISDAERETVVCTFNGGRTGEVPYATVGECFAEWVRRTPDAIAAVLGEEQITYAGLAVRADQIARMLRAAGGRRGALVGICMERSFDMLATVLGILSCGAAYVPLDPDYPAERLEYMTSDAGVSIVVTQAFIDAGSASVAEIADTSSEAPATPEDVAYAMYTSGSTGRPKGVLVPHRAIVRLVRETNYVQLGADERILGFAPLAFDASTFEIWAPLLNGGRVVLAPPGLPSLDVLGETIERQGVTTMWLTAPLFEQMVDTQLHRFGGVRQIISGGDVLSPRHVRRAQDALPHCTIINGYGPTENTTFTACYRIPPLWPADVAVPIGRPIARTTVYVLDEHRNPVPACVTGELYTGGLGVGLGYINRPELTAERFVPDPFSARPGAHMYRTGDRVRWLADGTLQFFGRADGQLKIHGFRVEPGEIEAVLVAHPSVRAAVVVGRKDAADKQRLIAYVVPESSAAVAPDDLRAYIAERLPAYLVPSRFIAIDALPLTPSGKLDRLALPDSGGLTVAERPAYCAPRSALEEVLVSMWGDVLGDEQIGVHDNFFVLGGHSLVAMRVLSRIRDAFDIELPFRTFFNAPTVARLGEALTALERKPGSLERIAQLTLKVMAMSADELHLALDAPR